MDEQWEERDRLKAENDELVEALEKMLNVKTLIIEGMNMYQTGENLRTDAYDDEAADLLDTADRHIVEARAALAKHDAQKEVDHG